MGQHKTSKQLEILLKFMEQHVDLARGFVKGDRVCQEQSLWIELAGELNASGPPRKEVPAWKKVWTDWKLSVKQRLGHNKCEATKTGGRLYNTYILTPSDEQVAIICGLYASVDGVKGAKGYCAPYKQNGPKAYDLPTTSTSSRTSSTPQTQSNPIALSPSLNPMLVAITCSIPDGISVTENFHKRPSPGQRQIVSTPTTSAQVGSRKRKRQVSEVHDVIEMEAAHFSKIAKNLEQIKKEIKANRFYLKGISRNLKENTRLLREQKILKEKEINEMTRHKYVMEKHLQSKNELKLQLLHLEQMKKGPNIF